jgi:hypothetical protein
VSIEDGPPDTGMVATTLLVFGSTRVTLPALLCAVHSAPSPKVVASATAPVSMRSNTLFVRSSMRTTESL